MALEPSPHLLWVSPLLLLAFACGTGSPTDVGIEEPVESSQEALLEGETISSSIDSDGFLTCTGGRVATGWNSRDQRLLCTSGVVSYRKADLDKQQWGVMRNGYFACAEQWAVVGLKVERNIFGNIEVKFRCARLGRNSETGRTSTVRNSAKACAEDEQMSGYDVVANKILCARRRQKCFGALGDQCNDFHDSATNTWAVNGGSFAHDECCFRSPSGRGCVNALTDVLTHDGQCVDEWEHALDLAQAGRSWRRVLDPSVYNRTGLVVFSQYCAQTGQFVDGSDVDHCCSRKAHIWDRTTPSAAVAQSQRFNLQGSVNPNHAWVRDEPSTNINMVCD